jgi:Domain of unknown function (DUF1707)
MGAGRGHFRASHADREHVIETLKAAFVQGRLTIDELDLRVGQAFVSRTYSELAALTADIPTGLAGVQPLRRPARPQAQPPVKRTVTRSAWVILAADLILLLLLAAFFRNQDGLTVAVLANLVALPLAGGQLLDSWRERHSGGQLPPRPAQRGRALEGKQDDRIGNGNDLIPFAARRDARARHLPDHRIVQRARRSLTVPRDQRRPARPQVTA